MRKPGRGGGGAGAKRSYPQGRLMCLVGKITMDGSEEKMEKGGISTQPSLQLLTLGLFTPLGPSQQAANRDAIAALLSESSRCTNSPVNYERVIDTSGSIHTKPYRNLPLYWQNMPMP